MKHFQESIKFKKDVHLEANKEYLLFYDVENEIADIKEVIGYSGNQPIFKNLDKR